jgi:hypothetical protein
MKICNGLGVYQKPVKESRIYPSARAGGWLPGEAPANSLKKAKIGLVITHKLSPRKGKGAKKQRTGSWQ